MPAIVTQDFKYAQVDSYLSKVTADAEEKTYVFIGNPLEWDVESEPPVPVDNAENQQTIWDTMFAAKRVNASNIAKVLKRRNWTIGQVFAYYSIDMGDISETNFYCMTASLNVYKCIWNNFGGQSTIEPTNTSTAEVAYSDGYIWKYMYTVDASQAVTFLTPEYMPVKKDSIIQAAAANTAGSVMYVIPAVAGSGYLSADVANTGEIEPAIIRVSTVDGSGMITAVEIISGGLYTGSGNLPIVVSGGGGAGANLSAVMTSLGGNYTVSSILYTNGGSGYTIPTVSAINGNGTGFAADIVGQSGGVGSVRITNKGSGYTFLSLSTTGGTGAVLTAVLAPIQGHGFDAEIELGATSILFNTTIILPNSADTGTKYPLSNSYRTIGIISNINAYGTANSYTGNVGTNLEYVTGTIESGSGFQQNEVVQGSVTNGQAKVVEFVSGTGTLKLIRTLDENFTGFEVGEILTGVISGTTMTINAITLPDIEKYSGSVKYVENRTSISRTPDQFEEIKIVIEF